MLLPYVEMDSKKNHMDLLHTQTEDMREPYYSNNPNIVACYHALMLHMATIYKDSHISLQLIYNPTNRILFKKNVNVLKDVLVGIIASMAAKVGIVGDFINKSFRLMSILRVIANGVLDDVIILVTRH
jgi:hypothetical protein